MASPTPAPAETDALRGGIYHDDARRPRPTPGRRVVVALAVAGALVCLVVVAATASAPSVGTSMVTNLAARGTQLRGTFSVDRERQDDTIDRVADEPPPAWEVLSDPQPGPPAGHDDEAAQSGPDRLRDMLLERFGLPNPEENTDIAAPLPVNHEELAIGTQERGDADESSKQQLEKKLLETFGLSGPLPPSENTASEALTTGNELDDETLKKQLRDMLLDVLMPPSDPAAAPTSWNWLDPATDSYGQVVRATGSEDDVDVPSVLSYLREQRTARSEAEVGESFGVDAQYARTVGCFARGAKQMRKFALSRDDFERVVGWMNGECQPATASGGVRDADESTASPETGKVALEKAMNDHYERLVGDLDAGHHDAESAMAQAQALRRKIAACVVRATEDAANANGLVDESQLDDSLEWIATQCASLPPR